MVKVYITFVVHMVTTLIQTSQVKINRFEMNTQVLARGVISTCPLKGLQGNGAPVPTLGSFPLQPCPVWARRNVSSRR